MTLAPVQPERLTVNTARSASRNAEHHPLFHSLLDGLLKLLCAPYLSNGERHSVQNEKGDASSGPNEGKNK